jgi:hypothetical protein
MKKKLAIAIIALTLIPTTANARGSHYYHPHTSKVKISKSGNAFKQYRHQRLYHARKGVVIVYNP